VERGVILRQYHWSSPTASKRSFFFQVCHSHESIVVGKAQKWTVCSMLQHLIVDHAVLIPPIGWPVRSLSWRLKFLSRNCWNHFLHVLYDTAFLPKAEQIIFLHQLHFFKLKREKKTVPQHSTCCFSNDITCITNNRLCLQWIKYYYLVLKLKDSTLKWLYGGKTILFWIGSVGSIKTRGWKLICTPNIKCLLLWCLF